MDAVVQLTDGTLHEGQPSTSKVSSLPYGARLIRVEFTNELGQVIHLHKADSGLRTPPGPPAWVALFRVPTIVSITRHTEPCQAA